MNLLAIKEKCITVSLGPRNVKHYELLGYYIPRKKNINGKLQIPLNTYIIVKVDDLTPASNVIITKICDTCEGESKATYDSLIKCRKTNGTKKDFCKKCSLIKRWKNVKSNVPHDKSLSANYPHLITEWNNAKNNKTPDGIFASSHDLFWWTCSKCGSDYMATANHKTNMNSKCPYCVGRN